MILVFINNRPSKINDIVLSVYVRVREVKVQFTVDVRYLFLSHCSYKLLRQTRISGKSACCDRVVT
jgi:hypothetical protein